MILVFGANGMLGSAVCRADPKGTVGLTRQEFTVDKDSVPVCLDHYLPDAVINCIGITDKNADLTPIRAVNSDFPQRLADECQKRDIRLIHISTDCVFDGKRGQYTEGNEVSPVDVYGRSKVSGEFYLRPHLTVRCSFISYPDPKKRGLFAWLLERRGGHVLGYSNVLWNGLTADALATELVDLAYRPRIWGVRHLFGSTYSKYALLGMINDVFDLGCTIVESEQPQLNRTLSTEYDETYSFPSMPDQLVKLRDRLMAEGVLK